MSQKPAGRTADIHVRGATTIVKLFRPGYTRERVEEEARLTRIARQAGLPVPEVGKVIEQNGRYGLELERLHGPLLLDLACREPSRMTELGKVMAESHRAIHCACIGGPLPSLRARLRERIDAASDLHGPFVHEALATIGESTSDECFCHGDFHPGNLISTARGVFVIDWADATRGPAEADVARSVVLMRLAEHVRGTRRKGQRTAIRQLLDAYLQEYCGMSGIHASVVTSWMPVIAGARLSERITAERHWLIRVATGLCRTNEE